MIIRIPKTELVYSYPYNKLFDPSFTYKRLIALKQKCRTFEQLYKKHIKAILKLIAKYSERWRQPYIPIYIVEKARKSFSHPLTLRYNKDARKMLLILIHELIHNNISKKFNSSKELHAYIEPIFEKVLQELAKPNT